MRAAALSAVMSSSTGTGSCYKEALAQSLLVADQLTASRKIIVCLGDGQPACQGQDPLQYDTKTLEEVKAQNIHRVQINTLGVGSGDYTWLKDLADQNGGYFTSLR